MMSIDDQDTNRIAMLVCGVMTVLSALLALGLIVVAVMHGLLLLIPAVLVAIFAALFAMMTDHYIERMGSQRKVFANAAEQEVLNRKQQRTLRVARADVVMQRALIEVENERDNLVHRQLEAANDPAKPPHKTRFSGYGD